MIMAKPSDLMTLAYSPRARIQFVQVDVADAARGLEQSHLCGPTACLALAETLAGAPGRHDQFDHVQLSVN